MNVRLLACSQSSHAPHPALSRCLNDLGVFLTAFPQRVEMMEKGNKKMIKCYVCGIDDIDWCDCVYHLEGKEREDYYWYVKVKKEGKYNV